MKYMILIATDTEPGAPAESPDEIESWHSEGVRRGIRQSGGILSAVSEAKTKPPSPLRGSHSERLPTHQSPKFAPKVPNRRWASPFEQSLSREMTERPL